MPVIRQLLEDRIISTKFVEVDSSMSSKKVQIQAKRENRCFQFQYMSGGDAEGCTYQTECSILNFVQYLNIFLFVCSPGSTSVGDNRKNAYIVEEVEIVV